ncbi:hypothetical protein TWF192_008435 [Orbilia oligospora]|uniref:Uncharacterized protein n=1 Tax=Orbilia oligospora TaxID=2813651 RepID=A0A6G1M3R7_ORBOL|nr:hypothetical protein TWF191_002865 [Orbilia oligospora]KAF3242967.1 hypothetical protein TWF192_008435 [Orbilia oligospora]
MRFLCLHGLGTNSKVFETQTAAIRAELGEEHEYEFVDGTVPWPKAKELGDLFSDDDEYFAYYDPFDAESMLKALFQLEEYIEEEGPFDAVMGFSHGAALSSTLLLGRGTEREGWQSPFKLAVFLAGGGPLSWEALHKNQTIRLDRDYDPCSHSLDRYQFGWPTRFFEAHGTGTLLGDLIESAAIGTVFRPARSSEDPFGASKANIGHLGAVSGIAGVIKSVLVLEKRAIPPIADLITLNPKIDDTYYRLKFPTEATPWPSAGVRRASVNSFGFGGTNAHIILDDAKGFLAEKALDANHNTDMEELKEDLTSQSYLIVLSAADRNGVQRLNESYNKFFAERPLQNSDIKLQRFFIIFGQRTLSASAFRRSKELDLSFCVYWSRRPVAENGGRVDAISVVFNSESIEQSAQYLRDIGCSWDLETEIKKEGSESRVDEPEISQPVSCPLQIALVDLLDRIKLRPAIVLGHSSGEVAAAYCKGAISHLSAIKIAYYRGLGGAAASRDPIERSMMSVRLSEADVIAALQEISIEVHDLHVACINSPTNVTTAGDDGHLNALKAIFDQKGTFARKLKVSCAYNSPHMALVANEYFSRAGKIEQRVKGPTHQPIPMISDIDGDMVSDSRLQDSDYWIQNMCSAVRFTDNAKKVDKLASLAVSGRETRP